MREGTPSLDFYATCACRRAPQVPLRCQEPVMVAQGSPSVHYHSCLGIFIVVSLGRDSGWETFICSLGTFKRLEYACDCGARVPVVQNNHSKTKHILPRQSKVVTHGSTAL